MTPPDRSQMRSEEVPHCRCWVEVDGDAIRKNIHYLRTRCRAGTMLVAIVKANGFGHGMIPVARLLIQDGVEALGVAHVHEARELRRSGIQIPILILSAALPSEYPEILRLKVWPMISTLEEGRALQQAAQKLRRTAEVHFKIDTGMGRVGLWPSDALPVLRELLVLKNLRVLAIATHFAQAENNPEFTGAQVRRFDEFRRHFPNLPWHVANSAATCQKIAPGGAMVRVGLAIYGIPPLAPFALRLRPALSWKSRITLLRDLSAGRTISYGSTYVLPAAQRIATVAVGYGDGYPRALSDRAEVLVGGRRCPVRGRVTMDQIMVDVSAVPRCRVEDEVVLVGRQNRQRITLEEVADRAGTIPYEIATGISARVPRFYRNWS